MAFQSAIHKSVRTSIDGHLTFIVICHTYTHTRAEAVRTSERTRVERTIERDGSSDMLVLSIIYIARLTHAYTAFFLFAQAYSTHAWHAHTYTRSRELVKGYECA